MFGWERASYAPLLPSRLPSRRCCATCRKVNPTNHRTVCHCTIGRRRPGARNGYSVNTGYVSKASVQNNRALEYADGRVDYTSLVPHLLERRTTPRIHAPVSLLSAKPQKSIQPWPGRHRARRFIVRDVRVSLGVQKRRLAQEELNPTCCAGKPLTALWLHESLSATQTLILVPFLRAVGQTPHE